MSVLHGVSSCHTINMTLIPVVPAQRSYKKGDASKHQPVLKSRRLMRWIDRLFYINYLNNIIENFLKPSDDKPGRAKWENKISEINCESCLAH